VLQVSQLDRWVVAGNGGDGDFFLISPFNLRFFFQFTCSYIKDILVIHSSTDF